MGDSHAFGGIKLDPVSRLKALAVMRRAISRDDAPHAPVLVTFLNPDYARRAFLEEDLRERIGRFDLVLADGIGVVLLGRPMGVPIPERITTDSLMPAVFDLCRSEQKSVFLFGSAPGVSEAAADALRRCFPGLDVRGTHHGHADVLAGHPGSFDVQDSRAITDVVNQSGADVVLVGLPTPLQQRWCTDMSDRLDPRLVITVGSYLDHLAEVVDGHDLAWYPTWVDSARLNWAFRFAREPRRLWRRYTVEAAEFVLLALRARQRERRLSTFTAQTANRRADR